MCLIKLGVQSRAAKSASIANPKSSKTQLPKEKRILKIRPRSKEVTGLGNCKSTYLYTRPNSIAIGSRAAQRKIKLRNWSNCLKTCQMEFYTQQFSHKIMR